MPQWLSASVKSVAGARTMQMPKMHRSVPFSASPVYVLPRVGSFSWYVDPETVVSSGTVPPYRDLPSPVAVSMLSQASIWAPVRASVTTVRATGLPAESSATAFVCQASLGEPCRASTTNWGLAVVFFSASPRFAARSAEAARSAAFGADTAGLIVVRDIGRVVARLALR